MLDMVRKALLPLNMRVGAVSARHIPEIRAEFEAQYAAREIGESSYKIMMNLTESGEGSGISPDRTILIVAMPSPPFELIFRLGGKTHMALIPPTYMDYVKRPPEIERLLNDAMESAGCAAEYRGKLPVKLLAVRSGLAEYGRNNVTYVEGMGSFVYLSAYLTNLPCEDGWRETRRMALCDSCARCVKNCPTGTIRADRRVIDPEKCLTWHNERDSGTPFPGWLDHSAHNSIVGCMRCQAVCPMNRDHAGRHAGPMEFDEEETALLLGGKPMDALPQALREKLEQTCLNTFYETVARNLNVLIS